MAVVNADGSVPGLNASLWSKHYSDEIRGEWTDTIGNGVQDVIIVLTANGDVFWSAECGVIQFNQETYRMRPIYERGIAVEIDSSSSDRKKWRLIYPINRSSNGSWDCGRYADLKNWSTSFYYPTNYIMGMY